MVLSSQKIVQQFLIKLNIPYDLTIVLLGIYPREMEVYCPHKCRFRNIHVNFIGNNLKLPTTQMFLDGQINTMEYPYCGILLSNKKKKNIINTFKNWEGSQGNKAERKKILKIFHTLCNIFEMRESQTWRRDLMIARGQGGGEKRGRWI